MMKKNFLFKILSVCVICVALVFGVNLTPKLNAKAYTPNAKTFTIKDAGTTLDIMTGADASTSFATGLASLDAAIDKIVADGGLQTNETIEIVFDNVSLEAEERVSLQRSFVFSGTLNTVNTSPLFVLNNASNGITKYYTFEDITLTNTNNTLENFSFVQVEGLGYTDITLNDAYFNLSTTSTEMTYAIKYISTNNKLTLKGIVEHQTTILYNYLNEDDGKIELFIDEDETVEDNFYYDTLNETYYAETPNLVIAVPFNIGYYEILCENVSIANDGRFDTVAEYDFYTVEKPYRSNTSLVTSASMSFTFDTNDATYNNHTPINSFYYNSGAESHNFPTAEDMTRTEYVFDGWFGKFEYDSVTYYFDTITLNEFLTGSYTLADIPTVFATNVTDFEIENSFSLYKYSSKNTANKLNEYDAVEFMTNTMHQAPNFKADWIINQYDVTFESNGGTSIAGETYDFNALIEEPADPTKTGYTFAGWFTDNDTFANEFDFMTDTMPSGGITLYAKWTINSYTVTFNSNDGTSVADDTFEFNSKITKPTNPTKTGYVFAGWFTDNDTFANEFDFNANVTTASNITLYAKWTIKSLTVYFDANGGTQTAPFSVDYNGYATKPANPTRVGYTFAGWFTNLNLTQEAVFVDNKIQITANKTFYAKWEINVYNLRIYKNINNESDLKQITYESSLENVLPTNLTYSGHIFDGWYEDEACTIKFNYAKMPSKNITAYAKWISKPLPTFDATAQIYGTDKISPSFIDGSELGDFIIKYYVDGEWTAIPPSAVGSYDIMVTRNEDDTYARFEAIYKNAYVIERVEANYMWLIILLFIVAGLEFAVSIFLMVMRKMKINMVITAFAIPIGTKFIPGNQIILLAISGILVLAGLSLMIYQFVKLHRTLPIALFEKQDKETEAEKHTSRDNIVNAEEQHLYSAEDVEDLLKNDTVGKSIKEKHSLDEKRADFEEFKEKTPIGPVEYNYDDDDDDDGDLRAVSDEETALKSIAENNSLKTNVEFVEDEFVPTDEDEETKLWKSEDPFLKKDPNDYSSNNETDEN